MLGLWPFTPGGRPRVSYALSESEPVRVRFGGISNYKEVVRFFRTGKDEGNGLHYLEVAEGSKPGALTIELQWDRNGAELLIHCQNITVSERGEC